MTTTTIEPQTLLGYEVQNGISYPIVAAYWTRGHTMDLTKLWCPHCQKWHQHGRGNGHRWAHCHVLGSPYKEHGYVLKEVGEWTPELQRWKGRGPRPFWCAGCHEKVSGLFRGRPCPKCGRVRGR